MLSGGRWTVCTAPEPRAWRYETRARFGVDSTWFADKVFPSHAYRPRQFGGVSRLVVDGKKLNAAFSQGLLTVPKRSSTLDMYCWAPTKIALAGSTRIIG